MRRPHPRPSRGAVLFEVVLALTLFVGAAVVIGTSLNAAFRSVERSRLDLHASNLAATKLAELELGLLPWADADATPLAPPFEHWTCEIRMTPAQATFQDPGTLHNVLVIVRHLEEPVTHRLAQWLPAPQNPNAPSLSAIP